MTVNAKTVKTLPNGTHRLERGVYLRVQNDRRFWILRYSIDKKRRDIGLGDVDTPIATVRAKAATLKLMIAKGIDPAEKKAQLKAEKEKKEKIERKQRILFKDYYIGALERISEQRRWQGDNQLTNSISSVRKNALYLLGEIPVCEITTLDIVDTLTPIWDRPKGETLQQKLKLIFARAVFEGIREDNPAEWKVLDGFLPSVSAMKKGKPISHNAAVSAEELKRVVRSLIKQKNLLSLCLVFGILTVGRVSEYSKAQWAEVSVKGRTLSIPPERRKDKKTINFTVPLSEQAMKILARLPKKTRYVFQSPVRKEEGYPSQAALVKRIKSATTEDISTHGTRSTFSDWCANNDKNFLVSEKCLMHNVGGAVFMAYQRDDLLDKRRELLQEWADYICPMEWLDSLAEIA